MTFAKRLGISCVRFMHVSSLSGGPYGKFFLENRVTWKFLITEKCRIFEKQQPACVSASPKEK